MPKAPELSRFWRLRFENLAGLPQTPNMECPRVTYDFSEAVPAFSSPLRVQIRKVETSVTRCPNGAAGRVVFGVKKCIKRSRDPSIASDAPGPVLG